MQVSSGAVSLLCYLAIFMNDSVPNDSNELCILSHKDVSATADTPDVSFIGFHPTKKNLEEYAHGQRDGDRLCVVSLSID